MLMAILKTLFRVKYCETDGCGSRWPIGDDKCHICRLPIQGEPFKLQSQKDKDSDEPS